MKRILNRVVAIAIVGFCSLLLVSQMASPALAETMTAKPDLMQKASSPSAKDLLGEDGKPLEVSRQKLKLDPSKLQRVSDQINQSFKKSKVKKSDKLEVEFPLSK